MKENNMPIKEYWFFIDDSGNIHLTDKDSNFFVYSALVFENLDDLKEFREGYKLNLDKNFFDFEKDEVKAADIMSEDQRESVYEFIRNSKPFLVSISEEKNKVEKLVVIEKEYNNSNQPLRIKKKNRKNQYNIHKTYLVGQLISAFIEKMYNLNQIKQYTSIKVNIILDQDNLYFFKSCNSVEGYLKSKQQYLKKFLNINYDFKIEDSKKEYCLQGADFLANATLRVFNKAKKTDYLKYIQHKKVILIKKLPFYVKTEFYKLNLIKNYIKK